MERLLSDMPPAVCVKVEDSFYKVISEISTRTFGAVQFFSFQNRAIIEKIPARSGGGGGVRKISTSVIGLGPW